MSNPYGLNDFQWKMFNLDAALTGNGSNPQKILSVLRNQVSTPLDWILSDERAFYLSDGGYSRIAVSDIDGHIWPTSNSTVRVKTAWEHCAELIADVEAEVKAALKSAQ